MPGTARAITILISAAFVLAACQEDSATTTGSDDPSMSVEVAEIRQDCEENGGSWGARGDGRFTCYFPTSDANQRCSTASDCEGVCLARSQTCAPTTPFEGCHEVLTEAGQRATQCTN